MIDAFLKIIGVPLSKLILLCYNIFHNYGVAIVAFTFLAKVILLPISCWVQRNGITMVKIMPKINQIKINYFGDNETISEKTQELYKKEHYNPLVSVIPLLIQIVLLMGVIGAVKELLGNSNSILNWIPIEKGGLTLLMPLAAGLSAAILTWNQNCMNPLQKEQTKSEQMFTGLTSIAISLFLGAFVSLGTGIYWISSNLFSALQQPLLNVLVNPKKYVDYDALKSSKEELNQIVALDSDSSKELKKREKADYKRFFSIANKHLVFYSEKSGFYKYYQNCIEYLLKNTKGSIHYVTNDPNDQIFELAKQYPAIKPYYIGKNKIIPLMMKMDAKIVVMTTPGLDNFYIKKSYVSKDVEYIYMFHHMTSTTMVDLKGAYDNYDTIMCVGPHQETELRYSEKLYGLKERTLVHCGYGMMDNMLANYKESKKAAGSKKQILIAPSWGDDNILDSCIDPMIQQLNDPKYNVIIRPHPEYVKHCPDKIHELQGKIDTLKTKNITLETDFSSNSTIYSSDIMITDWSSIAFEYSYTTKRPCIFINTKMKVLNPDYDKYPEKPLDILLRTELGKSLEPDELDKLKETVEWILVHTDDYKKSITALVKKYVYNIGHSGEVASQYIIGRLSTK